MGARQGSKSGSLSLSHQTSQDNLNVSPRKGNASKGSPDKRILPSRTLNAKVIKNESSNHTPSNETEKP
jgi:hypothetical protein